MAIGSVTEAWQEKGACRGPDSGLFFPPSYAERRDEREAREARAKLVCQQCGVRAECLDFAVRTREAHGVWGGTSESERRNLLARTLG